MKALRTSLLFFWLFIASAAGFAHQNINSLRQQVQQSKAALRITRQKWQQAQVALQALEKKLAISAQALAKTNYSIYLNRRAMRKQQRQLAANKRQLALRMGQLAESLRGIEQWLNEPSLKWILSSNDPGDWSRLATYHSIIGHSQQRLIEELKTLQKKIVDDELVLEKMAVALKKEREKRKLRLVKLKSLKADRKQLVAHLRLSVQDQARQLTQNEAQLQSKLNDIHAQSEGSLIVGHFARLKGRLRWPVKGHLEHLFNRSIQGSELTWRGVLLQAPEDRLVRAVAPGRVVYADWMTGYGWLVIIEHDDGYMTLYGRNHYLYKKAGQSVRSGDVIARSGKSGGFRQPALYFSLRHNAEPLNPVRWLTRKYSA